MTEENNKILNEERDTTLTIGEVLRNKREQKGLSLKVISQQTKIHLSLLEYLENNDLDKLPSKAYVKGFVKSTSKILGIDQVFALKALENTYNDAQKEITNQKVLATETSTSSPIESLSPRATSPFEVVKNVAASNAALIAKMVAGVTVLTVLFLVVKNVINRSTEKKSTLPTVLSTAHQKIEPINEKTSPEVKKVDATAVTTPPQEAPAVETKEIVKKPEVKIEDLGLKAILETEKQFTEDNSLTPAQLDEIFPTRFRVRLVKGTEFLFLNAVDGDSWITYKVDNDKIRKYVLRQGRTLFLHGANIRLFLGNTNALKIFYNNKLIDLNSKTGVQNLILPDSTKTKYMSPLFIFQKDGSVITSEEFLESSKKEASPPPI